MSDDKTPFNNPRVPTGRKCPSPKCGYIIPPHMAKLAYFTCPQCGRVGGMGPADRGFAR